MNRFLNIFIIILFFISCNVVKMVTQGETEISEDFYQTDIIPFNANPMSMIYKRTKEILNKVGTIVPTSIVTSTATTPAAGEFASEFNYDLVFSDNNSNSITTANWLKNVIQPIMIEYANSNRYESPTYRALHTINSICAAGVLIGNELGLTEFSYPADGTYNTTLGSKEIYALKKYCDMQEDSSMNGMTISIVISTPGATTIYDKQIDMMGNTYYIRYNSTAMAYAGYETNDNSTKFSRTILNEDRVSNGFSLEYLGGPNSATLASETTNALRVYYDSTSAATGLTAVMYRETYDSTPSDQTTFYISGYIGGSTGVVLHMNSNHLTNGAANTASVCLNNSNWSILSDATNCSAQASGITGTLTDGTTAVNFYNVFSGWAGGYTGYQSVSTGSLPGFSTSGNIASSAF